MKRAIITTYCVAIFLTVLIVPWKSAPRQVGNMQLGTQNCGYAFLFSPPSYCPNGAIDYGFVLLEIIAISAIGGLCFIFRDHLASFIARPSRLTEVWQNSFEQPYWKNRILPMLQVVWCLGILIWVMLIMAVGSIVIFQLVGEGRVGMAVIVFVALAVLCFFVYRGLFHSIKKE